MRVITTRSSSLWLCSLKRCFHSTVWRRSHSACQAPLQVSCCIAALGCLQYLSANVLLSKTPPEIWVKWQCILTLNQKKQRNWCSNCDVHYLMVKMSGACCNVLNQIKYAFVAFFFRVFSRRKNLLPADLLELKTLRVLNMKTCDVPQLHVVVKVLCKQFVNFKCLPVKFD